jgi:tRNA1(Val) A37 N6-methylase TrmN6
MREVLRTTNLVRLSWLQALLAESRIETVVLDGHTSVLEGSIGAIPRRLMVADEDHERAMRLLHDADETTGSVASKPADSLLGGRVALRQPASGYRVAIDPVLLAAAVPPAAGSVLDVGCGVGAASLCYAARVPGARVTGLELRADWAHLAEENARMNGMAGRVDVVCGDLLQPPTALESGSFDEVMANPPYLPVDRADMRQPPEDAPATVEGEAKLADWIAFCVGMAGPKGGITLIQRADRLDEILLHLHGMAGAVTVFPLWPRAPGEAGGADARRVIVQARKGSKAPMRLASGLVLHRADGAYSDAAERVLRDGASLAL